MPLYCNSNSTTAIVIPMLCHVSWDLLPDGDLVFPWAAALRRPYGGAVECHRGWETISALVDAGARLAKHKELNDVLKGWRFMEIDAISQHSHVLDFHRWCGWNIHTFSVPVHLLIYIQVQCSIDGRCLFKNSWSLWAGTWQMVILMPCALAATEKLLKRQWLAIRGQQRSDI